jgi:hypothetical protein
LSPKELKKRRADHAKNIKTKAYKKHHAAAIKHERKVRKAIGPRIPGNWILGFNDVEDTCIATAFANSLLVQTGYQVSDDVVLDVFKNTPELSLRGTIEALGYYTYDGWYPAYIFPSATIQAPGLIVAVDGGARFEGRPHTVAVSYRYDWITWGGEIPPELGALEQAYYVGWARR